MITNRLEEAGGLRGRGVRRTIAWGPGKYPVKDNVSSIHNILQKVEKLKVYSLV